MNFLGISQSNQVNSQDEPSHQCQWLTPVILATWEAEIRRITV
jgi:hypothetical protein